MSNINAMNNIDSTTAIFQFARGVVPYINECLAKIESIQPGEDCKGSALQQHKAYKAGLIEAYNDIKNRMIKSGFAGTGGVSVSSGSF